MVKLPSVFYQIVNLNPDSIRCFVIDVVFTKIQDSYSVKYTELLFVI